MIISRLLDANSLSSAHGTFSSARFCVNSASPDNSTVDGVLTCMKAEEFCSSREVYRCRGLRKRRAGGEKDIGKRGGREGGREGRERSWKEKTVEDKKNQKTSSYCNYNITLFTHNTCCIIIYNRAQVTIIIYTQCTVGNK